MKESKKISIKKNNKIDVGLELRNTVVGIKK